MPALNTTFTADVNATFINRLLSALTIEAVMHASMKRLLDYAKEATKHEKEPITDFAQIGARMDATSAVMTNWKSRGLSRDGALTAEEVFGCSAVWLLKGSWSPSAFRGATPGSQAHSMSHQTYDDGSIRRRTIEDAYRSGEGWSGEDGLDMLSPQEVELVGIFRQLGATARKVTLEALRSTRDQEEHEAESLQYRLRSQEAPAPRTVRGRSAFGDLDDGPAPAATKKRAR